MLSGGPEGRSSSWRGGGGGGASFGEKTTGPGEGEKITGTVSFEQLVERWTDVERRVERWNGGTVDMLKTNVSQVQKYRNVPKHARFLFVVALNSKVNMRIGLLDISNLTNPVSSRRGVAVSNRILN